MDTDKFSLNKFLLAENLDDTASSKHVEAWLKYKLCGGSNDPDSSEEAREFYTLIWGDFLKILNMEVRPYRKTFSKDPSKYVQGDWMCSIATVFQEGLKLFVQEHENLNSFFRAGLNNVVGGICTYALILIEDINKPSNERKFQKFWDSPELKQFIRTAYTYANLIIVPDGFNSARARPTKDYWDRTLQFYFANFIPEDPLHYRKTYNVGTPFYKLIKQSICHNDALSLSDDALSLSDDALFLSDDALFLSGWLDDNEAVIMLPDKHPQSFDEWLNLVREMTRRIDNRRILMQKRYPELKN